MTEIPRNIDGSHAPFLAEALFYIAQSCGSDSEDYDLETLMSLRWWIKDQAIAALKDAGIEYQEDDEDDEDNDDYDEIE